MRKPWDLREYEPEEQEERVVYVEKREGCFSKFLKIIGLLVFLAVLSSFLDDKPKNNKTVKPTSAPSATQAAYITDGIRGSSAYDITVGLEQIGFPKAERKQTVDGYTFDGVMTDENGTYTYFVIAEKASATDFPVKYAYFTFLGEDAGFMKYGTTMPYDSANAALSKSVVTNLATTKEITVGDAYFKYSPIGDNGGMLEIASTKCMKYIMPDDND